MNSQTFTGRPAGCAASTKYLAWILALVASVNTGLGQDTAARSRADRGFTYAREVVPEMPWSINIVKISRTNNSLGFQSSLAAGRHLGLGTLTEHVARFPRELGKPLVAMNGDYFIRRGDYGGDPEGLQILGGELISGPSTKSCFWMDEAGEPRITNVVSRLEVTWPDGTTTPIGLNEERPADRAVLYTPAMDGSTHTSGGVELILEPDGEGPWLPLGPGRLISARISTVRDRGNTPIGSTNLVLSVGPTLARRVTTATAGARLKISTETIPSLRGVPVAIGGGPALLAGGKLTDFQSTAVRHPRSAIGWNKDFYFLVQVDGRQRDHSVGMTLQELAERMKQMGCEYALNLDGGGSSTIWMLGQIVNSPSQGAERPMGNAIILVQKERVGSTSAPGTDK
jgi:hypothetical protein